MKIFTRALHGLTGCYVMDALDGRELDWFERHLHRCRPCAGEVRGFAETATRIAMAASRPPPPGLREQVLTAATQARQLPPVTSPRSSPRRRSPSAAAASAGQCRSRPGRRARVLGISPGRGRADGGEIRAQHQAASSAWPAA